jgi:hypothetical protein
VHAQSPRPTNAELPYAACRKMRRTTPTQDVVAHLGLKQLKRFPRFFFPTLKRFPSIEPVRHRTPPACCSIPPVFSWRSPQPPVPAQLLSKCVQGYELLAFRKRSSILKSDPFSLLTHPVHCLTSSLLNRSLISPPSDALKSSKTKYTGSGLRSTCSTCAGYLRGCGGSHKAAREGGSSLGKGMPHRPTLFLHHFPLFSHTRTRTHSLSRASHSFQLVEVPR